MTKQNERMNVMGKVGLALAALALGPALFALSHLNDDSAARAEAKAQRNAVEEARNIQLQYDEINRRLGNR